MWDIIAPDQEAGQSSEQMISTGLILLLDPEDLLVTKAIVIILLQTVIHLIIQRDLHTFNTHIMEECDLILLD